jgi:hypothetical protein
VLVFGAGVLVSGAGVLVFGAGVLVSGAGVLMAGGDADGSPSPPCLPSASPFDAIC